jgi:ribosomal protein S18 acetylase RimI-like enzyme
MGAAALAVSRMRPALTWRALDGDLVAGEVRARLRPDNRWFVYFDTWRADAYPPLADAVAHDLGRDLYVTLEDAEYDALDACVQAGFAVHRRESYYRIPADRAVAGLAGAVLPAGLDVLSAADADITRLRRLDDALRQDVPGSEGWRWDAEEFRAETFGPFFDPATYLVAVDRASGEYAGLVRIWRNRAGPRLGLIATLARYRRRGVARALLGQAFAVLAARGETNVTCEVDDTNVASVSWLTGLGARRYGGNAELIRRQPGRRLPDRLDVGVAEAAAEFALEEVMSWAPGQQFRSRCDPPVSPVRGRGGGRDRREPRHHGPVGGQAGGGEGWVVTEPVPAVTAERSVDHLQEECLLRLPVTGPWQLAQVEAADPSADAVPVGEVQDEVLFPGRFGQGGSGQGQHVEQYIRPSVGQAEPGAVRRRTTGGEAVRHAAIVARQRKAEISSAG